MHFTVEAQRFAERYLTEGSIAIDATAGNGFDSLFLAERVGDSGIVYAIDIQENAIQTVRGKLERAGTIHRCRLLVDSHANLDTIVDSAHVGKIDVAMFNLGYLPFGDKTRRTQLGSTLIALGHVAKLIRPGGLISILAYRGHLGGTEETEGVSQWVDDRRAEYQVDRFHDPANAASPILFRLADQRGSNSVPIARA
jgi:predicted methyltransferase